MDYSRDFDLDVPDFPAIKGGISRAWRSVCHSRENRRGTQQRAHRRMRRAVRQAIVTNDTRHLPEPLTAWHIC